MKTFTMRLGRMAMWGAVAAATLLVAVFATRSEIGAQRAASVLSAMRVETLALLRPSRNPINVVGGGSSTREDETRRLAEAVRDLATDSDQLKSRIAAIERNMDDATGTLSRNLEPVKTGNASPWPGGAQPVAPTSSVIATVVTPVVPAPDGVASPLPPSALMSAGPVPSARPSTEYAVDLGSAASIDALRARWEGIHAAHAPLFDGLMPAVTLKTLPHSNRVELRLIVGPIANAGLAAQLCTSLKASRRLCEPVVFDRARLALQ